MSGERQSERYNPITGTGIPATPARANTSAIFGGSPGAIEYMFIPPSASTRPTRPSSYSERRQSLSRESLRRSSFSPVAEGKADSDGCSSSISDVSECGSEADLRDRTKGRKSSLPKARKPISRTTSTRLVGTGPKPCVMQRAHSFTRGTTESPPREGSNDVTHSETDLINQGKRTGVGATSRIPTKTGARTGTQSSRIPTKRSDSSSGSPGAVVKRTASDTQGSGIPVKASGQKRVPDDSREPSGIKSPAVKASGIPVKGSGIKPPQYHGTSKIPHVEKKASESGREKASPEKDVKLAANGSELLLKREGTGDELRRKNDTTKSKLPRRSSIPRASNQQKTKNENEAEGLVVKGKRHEKKQSPRLSPRTIYTEQQSTSKIPVTEVSRSAAYSPSSFHRSDSGYGDTDSVSSKEDAPMEIGNEFSLSRENSKSKIPVRKNRVATKQSGGTPTGHEVAKDLEVTKRKSEKQKHEMLPTYNATPEISGKHISSGSKPQSPNEQRPTTKGNEGKTVDHLVSAKPAQMEQKGSPSVAPVERRGRCAIGKELENNTVDNISEIAKLENVSGWKERRSGATQNGLKPKHTSPDHVMEVETIELLSGGKGHGSSTGPREDMPVTAASHSGTSLMDTGKHSDFTHNVLPSEKHLGIPTDVEKNLTNIEKYLTNEEETASTGTPKTGDKVVSSDALETPRETAYKHEALNTKTMAKPINNIQKTGPEPMSSKSQNTVVNSMHGNGQMTGAEVVNNHVQGTEREPVEGDVQKISNTSGKVGEESERENAQKTGAQPAEHADNHFGKTGEEIKNGFTKGGLGKTSTRNKDKGTGIQVEGKNTEKTAETKDKATLDIKKTIKMSALEKDGNDRTMNSITQNNLEPSNEEIKNEPNLDGSKIEDTEPPGSEVLRKHLTCLECRMEQNEANEDVLGTSDVDVICQSDARRYPTFISPRKSLVLCKRHEKLKNQRSEPDDSEIPLTPPATDDVAMVTEDDASKDLGKLENVKTETDINIKTADGHKLKSNITKRTTDQKATSKRSNAETYQDIGATSLGRNVSQRSTVTKNAQEKETPKAAVSKGSHSPLLALKRDKKFVSREDLAQGKNIEDIKSALSLEWDDVGTELSPPNFSDEDDVSEPGTSDVAKEVSGDDRRPSVKLMNTNEALDKLKMIQNLIMKEAENRSRKESVESAGKSSTSSKGHGREDSSRRKFSLETKQTDKAQNGKEPDSTSSQESPTSKLSSPTIWDRVTNNTTISQDQTTELLNETLAKLKASPQLSGNTLSRRTPSSRSLPGSRQASKERLLSDTERPVYVYTSSWMNTSGKNSRGSSLSLCSANRSLPSSRQNLAKDPFSALKRSESASGRMDKENGKQPESKFRLSNFDEMLSDDGTQEGKKQTPIHPIISPVSEQPVIYHNIQLKKPRKRAKPTKKKSKNTAATMNNMTPYGVSMDDLTDGKTRCQCGGKKCVIS